MAVKTFNIVSVSAVLAIFLLFTTLWNLQARPEYFSDGSTHHYSQENGTNATLEGGLPSPSPVVIEKPEPTETRPSWREVAFKYGTDKVTVHHYQYMYEKYLQPIRDRPLKMLEIGLGCNMGYGPGHSYHTWLEFFPNVDMYYIEYDAACVEKWAANITDAKVFTGDQADTTFLHEFMAQSGGGFDIIVDDGGHTMQQQIVSLNTLFDIVLPGGIYFCEDLATSYDPSFGAVPGEKTMMQMISELLHDLNKNLGGAPPMTNAVSRDMRSIECGEEICAFFKKELEITELRG
ncbi:8-demethyl-8-alpha-L-rhamnosyl tetracenomycin-C 2'-O-methyltransferase [Lachnellula suecica]|uniref:8-demethyl-8-alpha-L-rhamnosyl tetracenomycin-C 2'-O-methyltransferase n=1 Tax=Lachnellula suecica TaxID=602035 RepID=A0A8T9C3W7_9HELO|nr:8-demethyl-8-alpha-L-rhamnosyl tetracenomycin-C 2'-O-methyltransferase [Lachnellula suecica]